MPLKAASVQRATSPTVPPKGKATRHPQGCCELYPEAPQGRAGSRGVAGRGRGLASRRRAQRAHHEKRTAGLRWLTGNRVVHAAGDQWLRRPAPSDLKVIVVDIDRASIDALGTWPWPRETMARLVEAVATGRHPHGTPGMAIAALWPGPGATARCIIFPVSA